MPALRRLAVGACLLLPALTASAGSNQWSGSGPFATGLGNRVIHALAISGDAKTVYAGTGSGTVFSYTLAAPTVSTGAATAVGSSGATFNGLINAQNLSTGAGFDYGLTTAYGATVAATPSPVGGAADTAVSATVSGLACNALYHYRATATNASGTGNGGDQSFSTGACPPQIISFANPGSFNFGTTPTLSASVNSGLTASFSSATPTVCSITSGGTLSFHSTGLCTIVASQPGNGSYPPASVVSQSFNVLAVAPGAPTAVLATATNAQATIRFTAPASNGGSAILNYTATSSGGQSGSCSGPAACIITVTGLGNGTPYTFTVTATNSAGTGVPSASSNSVTPAASKTYTALSATGTGNITASFTGGGANCGYTVRDFVPVSGIASAPPAGLSFPQGLFNFAVGGCTPTSTLNFTITYPQALPTATSYWKFGRTATDPTPHWYVLPATIAGATISFSIADGGPGDDDLTANGTIVDPGGPGLIGANDIPALSSGTLLLLSALLVLSGLTGLRRRRARP